MNIIKKSALALIIASSSHAYIPNNSSHVYEISQGSMAIPPVNGSAQLTIGGNINAYSQSSCSMLNKVFSISESFKNIKSSVTSSLTPIIAKAQGSIVGIGMYKLQQMNPGMYDLIQNTNFDFTEEFNLKVANCQEKMKNLQNGGGLYENILQVSDTQGYLDMLKSNEDTNGNKIDIVSKTNELEQKRGEWGIPWIHRSEGNSGGTQNGQKPIKLTSDVIIAGFNVMLNSGRALDDDKIFSPNDDKAGIARYWESPKKAAEWGTYVLGETQITMKQDKEQQESTAGYGLSSVINNCPQLTRNGDTCITNVQDWLWKLVNSKTEPTDDDLKKISPENFVITSDVITTIQNMQFEDRMVAVSSLAEKVATQNVINEALMLRRVIAAGLRVQEIQNVKEIRESIQRTQQNLDYDIKSVLFEHEARQKMMGSTVKGILNIREELKAQSSSSLEEERPLIKDGAMYKINKKEAR